MTETTDQEYRERAGAMANMLEKNPRRHNQRRWGTVEPRNECGTVGCIAGWGTLARKGIVTIAADGEMTWAPEALGPVASARSEYRHDYAKEDLAVPTLWRSRFENHAEDNGRLWFGLSHDAAHALFQTTVLCTRPNAAAIAVLRRLADGRLDRGFRLSAPEINRMVAEDRTAEESR